MRTASGPPDSAGRRAGREGGALMAEVVVQETVTLAYCRGLEDLGYDPLWVADRLATPTAPQTPLPR
jgi:hypothetical protein